MQIDAGVGFDARMGLETGMGLAPVIGIETGIGLLRFAASLIFGVVVSIRFAGVASTRRNRWIVGTACALLLIAQFLCWWTLGLDMTSKLYPVIIHLPMVLFLSLLFRRPWLISIASVLSAYLCLQAPRWVGFLGSAVFNSGMADHLVYIVAVFVAYFLLNRYVTGSVRQLMERSANTRLLLGAVPLFYYLFDYVTTIFTDALYQGTRWAVQFMPSTISVFYFVFVILYFAETQKQAKSQRERDLLTAELQMATTEFAALRKLQEHTAVYRHDMRHHFSFLQHLAAEGDLDGVKAYLKSAQSDMDAITPVRFCENEAANLILSDFSARAAQQGVRLSVETTLPQKLPLSDTEFCSLLSNSLENAITAAAAARMDMRAGAGVEVDARAGAGVAEDAGDRTVRFKALVHRNNLLISMENPYQGRVAMKAGLPSASAEGHGFGTRSMVSIAEAHGGQALFSAEDGVFRVKIMIPFHAPSR